MAMAQPGSSLPEWAGPWRYGEVDGCLSALEEIGNEPAACLIATICQLAATSRWGEPGVAEPFPPWRRHPPARTIVQESRGNTLGTARAKRAACPPGLLYTH